jgi:hypothetical protein
VKHEVKAARGTDEDTDGNTGAMRGTGWSARAARGMATVSEVLQLKSGRVEQWREP